MRKNMLKTVAMIASTALIMAAGMLVFKMDAHATTTVNVNIGSPVNSGELNINVGDVCDCEFVFFNNTGGEVTFNQDGTHILDNDSLTYNTLTNFLATSPNDSTTWMWAFTLSDNSYWGYSYRVNVSAPNTSASSSSSSSEIEYKAPEPQGPSAEEIRQQEIDEAVEAFFNEGSAAENKTVGSNNSSVNGFFHARKVDGVAIQPTAATEDSYIRVADTDKKKSKDAVKVADDIAGLINGTVGPCINVNYGGMVDGKFVPSTDGSSGFMWIGIPGNFRVNGARYYVVAVYEGGEFKVFDNIVNHINPADSGRILVNLPQAPSANVMYAIIRK